MNRIDRARRVLEAFLVCAGIVLVGALAEGQPIVATVGDRQISAAELEAVVAPQVSMVKNEEYRIRRAALDDLIAKALIEREAAARKWSVERLVLTEVDAKSRPVTSRDVQEVYERNRGRFQVSEADALKQVEERLHRQRVGQRRREFVEDLRSKSAVRIQLAPFRVPVDSNRGPSRGPREAPVTIVEFTDFQCPYCGRASGALKEVEQRYRDKVRIVFRDFPLSIHEDAPKAAEAAACANQQGRFWQMHDTLFENHQSLGSADLRRYAAGAGLDTEAFDRCLEAGTFARVGPEGREEGIRYGVTGTPTFFVNGRPLQGLQTLETLSAVIEEELALIPELKQGPVSSCSEGSE